MKTPSKAQRCGSMVILNLVKMAMKASYHVVEDLMERKSVG